MSIWIVYYGPGARDVEPKIISVENSLEAAKKTAEDSYAFETENGWDHDTILYLEVKLGVNYLINGVGGPLGLLAPPKNRHIDVGVITKFMDEYRESQGVCITVQTPNAVIEASK